GGTLIWRPIAKSKGARSLATRCCHATLLQAASFGLQSCGVVATVLWTSHPCCRKTGLARATCSTLRHRSYHESGAPVHAARRGGPMIRHPLLLSLLAVTA